MRLQVGACESCGRSFAPAHKNQRACNRLCGRQLRVAKGPTRPKLRRQPTLDFLLGDVIPACAGEDPELFFPEHGVSNARARKICYHCPLKDPCKAWALAQNSYLFGIWGGLTWADRNRSKR